jgi:hypothetical protein
MCRIVLHFNVFSPFISISQNTTRVVLVGFGNVKFGATTPPIMEINWATNTLVII